MNEKQLKTFGVFSTDLQEVNKSTQNCETGLEFASICYTIDGEVKPVFWFFEVEDSEKESVLKDTISEGLGLNNIHDLDIYEVVDTVDFSDFDINKYISEGVDLDDENLLDNNPLWAEIFFRLEQEKAARALVIDEEVIHKAVENIEQEFNLDDKNIDISVYLRIENDVVKCRFNKFYNQGIDDSILTHNAIAMNTKPGSSEIPPFIPDQETIGFADKKNVLCIVLGDVAQDDQENEYQEIAEAVLEEIEKLINE